ncbi:MAG: hypothetical protein LW808_001655 [Verrucomicrobiota bacterium]|nr:MAG: hypothetical protein LW808_001655 [Verrucomicrobiota bacterium]
MNWRNFLFTMGVVSLAGCAVEEDMFNMTPSIIPQNQSNLYTLTMALKNGYGGRRKSPEDVLQPYVVVDGERREMMQHPDGNNVFVYDYHFDGIGKIPYYYEVEYVTSRRGRSRQSKTKLFFTTVTNKYIFALDTNRGPIGARVSLVGCGLAQTDQVIFGDRAVESECPSTGAIEFTVPAVDCGCEYEVCLLSNGKKLPAGNFFVDISNLHCSSESIYLRPGESQLLVFMLDNPAPSEGLSIKAETDIPDDIIMPDIQFMAGERTVSVNITGGDYAAKGTLVLSADGVKSLEIPVEVSGPPQSQIPPAQSQTPPSEVSATPPFDGVSADNDVVVL